MGRSKRIKDAAIPSSAYSDADQTVLRQAASILGVGVEDLPFTLNPSQSNLNHGLLESETPILEERHNLGETQELERLFSLDNEHFVPPNPRRDPADMTLSAAFPDTIDIQEFPIDAPFELDMQWPTHIAMNIPEQAFPPSEAMVEPLRHPRGSLGSNETQDTSNSDEPVAENPIPFSDFACDADFLLYNPFRTEDLPEISQTLLPSHSLHIQVQHPVASTKPWPFNPLDSTPSLRAISTGSQGSSGLAAHIEQESNPENRMLKQTSRGPRKPRNLDKSPSGKKSCRGPFRNLQERMETGQTRKIGACIRCRMQRVRVSERDLFIAESVF
jgi:hypothetical protein